MTCLMSSTVAVVRRNAHIMLPVSREAPMHEPLQSARSEPASRSRRRSRPATGCWRGIGEVAAMPPQACRASRRKPRSTRSAATEVQATAPSNSAKGSEHGVIQALLDHVGERRWIGRDPTQQATAPSASRRAPPKAHPRMVAERTWPAETLSSTHVAAPRAMRNALRATPGECGRQCRALARQPCVAELPLCRALPGHLCELGEILKNGGPKLRMEDRDRAQHRPAFRGGVEGVQVAREHRPSKVSVCNLRPEGPELCALRKATRPLNAVHTLCQGSNASPRHRRIAMRPDTTRSSSTEESRPRNERLRSTATPPASDRGPGKSTHGPTGSSTATRPWRRRHADLLQQCAIAIAQVPSDT